MSKSRVTVEMSKDLDKILKDMTENYLKDGGEIEIECPHCGLPVKVHAGETTCPSCNNLITVIDEIKM